MNRIKEYIQIAFIAAVILLSAFFLGIMVNILNPLGVELNSKPKPEKIRLVKVIKKVPVIKTVTVYKDNPVKVAHPETNNLSEFSAGELAAIAKVEAEIKARATEKISDPLVKIDLAKAKELFDGGKAKFIDARPEYKNLEERIRGSISLSASRYLKQYETVKEKINKNDILVVYCSSLECKLSDNVAGNLITEGYKNVFVFEAGWQSWVDAGYPIEGLKVK